MNKQQLINELIRFDIQCYRKNGLIKTGKYKHEPSKFYLRLSAIYSKLSKEDINELLNIRKHEQSRMVGLI